MAVPRSRWRRLVRTVTLFLTLGALCTVAIAWALCAMGSAPVTGQRNGTRSAAFVGPLVWPVQVPSDWPPPNLLDSRLGRGLRMDVGEAAVGENRGPYGALQLLTHYRIVSVRSGWPLLAMHTRTLIVQGSDGEERIDRTPAVPLPFWFQQYIDGISEGYGVTRSLPIVPIWPAFILNALAYAAAFWLMLRVRGTVRAFARSRRGQCMNCGYPKGSSDVCTECGEPVSPAARA